MRTFKRCALAGAFLVTGLVGFAPAANASINGANGGATFTAGPTRFNAALDVSCTSSTVTVAPGVLAAVQSTPVTFPINLTYSGCSTSLGGATVNCRGVTLTALTASGGTATGRVNLPAYAPTPPGSGAGCVINTSTGCQIRVPTSASTLNVTGNDNGAAAAVLTVQRTGLAFTTSGGFACLGITSGTAFYESTPSNGDIPYTQTGGTPISFV